MPSTIKIYTTPWNNIDTIKNFLNSYLLKYRVYAVDKSLFKHPEKTLPIVEVDGELFYNPTIETLREVLDLTKSKPISYFDSIAIGGGIECFFYVDYQLKHNIQAIGITNKEMDIDQSQKTYDSLFRLPNPLLMASFYENKINTIEMLPTYRHFKIITDNGEVYTRSLFIVLDAKLKKLQLEHEDELHAAEVVFFEKKQLLQKLKAKRPRDPRERIFAVVGDHPDILDLVMELMNDISYMYPSLNFYIFVVSPKELGTFHPYILKQLEKTQKVRALQESSVTHIEKIGHTTTIRTPEGKFKVDYILEYNKSSIDKSHVKDLFDFDQYGYIYTDHNYKTKHPSVYSIPPLTGAVTKDKTALLDRYITCAEVAQRISTYINLT